MDCEKPEVVIKYSYSAEAEKPLRRNAMPLESVAIPTKKWTAAELRKLPPAERGAIMEAAAALAENEYRNNPELTAFEAFGKDDLHGDSANAQTR
jgi:hypothetical protein